MTFQTSHFSKWVVGYEAPSESSSNLLMYAAIAVVVIAVIAVGAFVYTRHH